MQCLARDTKKVYNIETSLCFIIQEDQNNEILKCLSQILSKIQKRTTIFSTKTTPDRDAEGFRTPLRLCYVLESSKTDDTNGLQPHSSVSKRHGTSFTLQNGMLKGTTHYNLLTDILQHTFKHCHQETLRRMSCANLRKID